MTLNLLRVSFVLLSFAAAVRVHAAGTQRNPGEFPEPKKSTRGFLFRNYYDHIPTPYVAGPLNADGTKVVELNGAKRWTLLLRKNENLFSPSYKFFDDSFQPHESKIQNCYYHGEMQGASGSFIAVSDCDGINGMIVDSTIRYSIHTLEKNEGVVIVKEITFSDGLGNDNIIAPPSSFESPKPNPNSSQNNENKVDEGVTDDTSVDQESPADSNIAAKNVNPTIQGSTNTGNTNENANPNNGSKDTNPGTSETGKSSNTESINTRTAVLHPATSKDCLRIKLRDRENLKQKLGTDNINYFEHNLAMSQPCTPEQVQEINIASSHQLENGNTNENANPNNGSKDTNPGTSETGKSSNTESINTRTTVLHPATSKDCLRIKLRDRENLKQKLGTDNINYFEHNLAMSQPCTPEQVEEINKASSHQLKKRDTTTSVSKYYDVAFSLTYMEDIPHDAQAEQYIADAVNMLQQYYKHHNFNGSSVRLSATHYIRSNLPLVKYTRLPRPYVAKEYKLRWNTYAMSKAFPETHIKFLLSRPIPSLALNASGVTTTNKSCRDKNANGLVFIRNTSVTNSHDIVGLTVHELGHATGIQHTDTCAEDVTHQTIMDAKRNPHSEWVDFAPCSLAQMKCTPSSLI